MQESPDFVVNDVEFFMTDMCAVADRVGYDLSVTDGKLHAYGGMGRFELADEFQRAYQRYLDPCTVPMDVCL